VTDILHCTALVQVRDKVFTARRCYDTHHRSSILPCLRLQQSENGRFSVARVRFFLWRPRHNRSLLSKRKILPVWTGWKKWIVTLRRPPPDLADGGADAGEMPSGPRLLAEPSQGSGPPDRKGVAPRSPSAVSVLSAVLSASVIQTEPHPHPTGTSSIVPRRMSAASKRWRSSWARGSPGIVKASYLSRRTPKLRLLR